MFIFGFTSHIYLVKSPTGVIISECRHVSGDWLNLLPVMCIYPGQPGCQISQVATTYWVPLSSLALPSCVDLFPRSIGSSYNIVEQRTAGVAFRDVHRWDIYIEISPQQLSNSCFLLLSHQNAQLLATNWLAIVYFFSQFGSRAKCVCSNLSIPAAVQGFIIYTRVGYNPGELHIHLN